MKSKIGFNLLAALFIVLALAGAPATHPTQAQELGPLGGRVGLAPQGTALGTAFTYQGRLTDTTGNPVAGPCILRFSLYQSAANEDPVGTPQTANGVMPDDGYFSVELDFGTDAFTGDARYMKIEVDCGSGSYTALSPRVELTPAPYAFYAVSTGALHGREVSDSSPTIGDVLQWDGNSWMPASGGAGNAWSLTGNSGTTPGANFVGTTDNQALEFRVNNTRTLRLEPNATSPNIIGGYSGNSVAAGKYGATIGGGGESGFPNRATANYGTVGGGRGNTASGQGATVGGGSNNIASDYSATIGGGGSNTASNNSATIGGGEDNTASGYGATVGGGWNNTASGLGTVTISGGQQNTASGESATIGGGGSNTASGQSATVGGGVLNTASGYAATVPGGYGAHASLYGQMAYASGDFVRPGDAQAALYVMRNQTYGSGIWEDLYLDGSSLLLTIAPTRTLTFDILVVGRSDAGESAGYYIWGVAENVGGTTTVWWTTMSLHEDDAAWDARAAADDTNDALLIQVMGNGEPIRWVATVRTAEVAW